MRSSLTGRSRPRLPGRATILACVFDPSLEGAVFDPSL